MRVLSWLSFVLSAVGRAAVVEPGLMSVVDKVVGVGRNCDIYIFVLWWLSFSSKKSPFK